VSTVQWSTGATTPSISFVVNADTIITATNNAPGCSTVSQPYTIQVSTMPTPFISSNGTVGIGTNALFTLLLNDSNANVQWQTNSNHLGWQNLPSNGIYNPTHGSLTVINVQLGNHLQPFRVIASTANCSDTSNMAFIMLSDTCIFFQTVLDTITTTLTVYDTVTTYLSVTDTLLIQTTITSINPPNNSNTLRVFPNPTNDHITIDYGNFSIMNGYQLKIENSLGQQVFQTNITQQSDYISLTNWGGNGLYFVRIINPQGNTIDIRKIVLQ
ncbi:MAG: T9SS type A sorting domain-containing protein, partial [Bacteroidota bacterium]